MNASSPNNAETPSLRSRLFDRPIHVSISIGRSPEQVWDYVQDISSHVDWMHDAAAITFVSDQTQGVGTSFDCLTKIGPIRLMDRMTITEWQPNASMGVRHEGLVTGEGVFTLDGVGPDRTVFSWRENLNYPWFFGGPVGAVFARPLLTAIWKRNLAHLRSRVEERE